MELTAPFSCMFTMFEKQLFLIRKIDGIVLIFLFHAEVDESSKLSELVHAWGTFI